MLVLLLVVAPALVLGLVPVLDHRPPTGGVPLDRPHDRVQSLVPQELHPAQGSAADSARDGDWDSVRAPVPERSTGKCQHRCSVSVAGSQGRV